MTEFQDCNKTGFMANSSASRPMSQLDHHERKKLHEVMNKAAKEELGLPLASLANTELIGHLHGDTKMKNIVCNLSMRSFRDLPPTEANETLCNLGTETKESNNNKCFQKLRMVSVLLDEIKQMMTKSTKMCHIDVLLERIDQVKDNLDEYQFLAIETFRTKHKVPDEILKQLSQNRYFTPTVIRGLSKPDTT